MIMDSHDMKLIERDIKREFRDVMPRKYWIFPTVPKIYNLSNCTCIEMPSYGSMAYRMKLKALREDLNKFFVMDIHYFDGKTTFILKNKK